MSMLHGFLLLIYFDFVTELFDIDKMIPVMLKMLVYMCNIFFALKISHDLKKDTLKNKPHNSHQKLK